MRDELKLALEQHERGLLDQAAEAYRHLLAAQPDHADAMHLLGVVAYQQGDPVRAAEWIGRAIARNPAAALYHANLALAYRAMGQVDRTIDCSRTALRLQPNYAAAANNLGLALLDQGQAEAAAAHFRTALRLQPNFAMACNNLGTALRLAGDIGGALAYFRQAVQLDPNLAEARTNLGQMLLEHGQPSEAREHCRAAVRLRPDLAEAQSNLGNVLREAGQLAEARKCYLEALRLQPRQAMVYNNMGQALQEEGKLDEALNWYLGGLELNPNMARLHCNLASLLEQQEKYAEATTRYEIALRLEPDYAEAHNGLGWVGHELGRYEEAQQRYRAALRLKPDFAAAHCNLGTVREELNDFAEAEHCFRQALRYDRQHAGAWSQLATLLRDKLPNGDLTAMRQLLADPELTDGKRSTLCFGLAQVLDAHKSYDEAGEHLRQANAIAAREWRIRGQGYDPAEHTRFIDRLLATFTPAYFQRMRGLGVDSERPIFIVGLPRSGTTLTEQVLASHSQVFGAGELRLAREEFDRAAGGDEKQAQAGIFDRPGELDAAGVQGLAGRYLDRLNEIDAAAPRIADKMPDNYQLLGFLATLFPRAKFVHCRRDLRDVALSCWITNFRHIRWASDPEHIAARFRDYQRVMEHWRQVLPVPMLEIDYEETVADLEGVARRLVSWCGLEWEPGCLAFYKGKQPIRTASVAQVRQPIYSRSVGRWKNYERSMGPLFAKILSPHENAF